MGRRTLPTVPTGTKLRGVNLVPMVEMNGGWPEVYDEWVKEASPGVPHARAWPNWWQWQIDQAVTLGVNAVRLFCGPSGVVADDVTKYPGVGGDPALVDDPAAHRIHEGGRTAYYTRATHVERVVEAATYIAVTKGLYLYVMLGDRSQWNYHLINDAYSLTTVVAPEYNAVIDGLEAVPGIQSKIVGYDMMQEDGLSYAALQELVPLLRVHTAKPLGMSQVIRNTIATDSQSLHNDGRFVGIQDFCDFYDFHLYTNPIDTDSVREFIARRADSKPVLIGEYGTNRQVNETTRRSMFTAARNIHELGEVVGSFCWALTDQYTSAQTNNQWGVLDRAGARREISYLFDLFTVARATVP